MEEPLLASSFLPPDVDAAAATATSSPPSYPAWVLLDKKAYFEDAENATAASAISLTGHIVKVTFCLADPPAVSRFCYYGNPDHFVGEPRVVSSEKDLVLLSFVFTGGPRSTEPDRHHGEYFIYRAGRVNGMPSLRPIGATPPGITNTLCVSIVPCDDGDKGEFFLADLSVTTTLGQYDLAIYSSKTENWNARRLELHSCSDHIRAVDLVIVPHKVISLGGGLVGWVDLWRGIVACNILEEDPFIYFIPLPKPDFNLPRIGNPKPVRDVICYNGVIKFVEMDHYFRQEVVRRTKRFKVTEDLDGVDKLYDSEILLLPHEDFLRAPGEQFIRVPDGWKIRTCYRRISWDHWRKGHSVHVDDILANNPEHSVMLPQILDGSGKSTLRNLTTAYPTLGLNSDDAVYLMSKVECNDNVVWMVGVDLGSNTVELLEPYCAERASYFIPDCVPWAFSEFLNPTPRHVFNQTSFVFQLSIGYLIFHPMLSDMFASLVFT
jgi:hypothetical protein